MTHTETTPGRFHKAVRPDGSSFHDPGFVWNTEPGGVTRHPSPGWRGAKSYLSVSTVPTDCTGMGWPARHLIVEPVEGCGVWTPEPVRMPHKRASGAWRTVEERPAHELLGPQGEHVAVLLDRLTRLTPDEARALADASWNAARNAARDAAARWGVTWVAAWGVTWDTAWDAAGGAARDVIGDAALGLLVRDLISTEHYRTLTDPVASVLGQLHPDDERKEP